MVTFYSGTPGSGKSYHMATEIKFKLRLGRNIICTENIDINKVNENGKRKIGNFTYVPIEEINTQFLYKYAYENHKEGKEHQTLIIIDEAHVIFNPREWQRKDRTEWLRFFSWHRHIGYDIIIVSQNDRQVDRQIRSQFEHEIKHRKVNNMFMMGFLLPTIFICIETYYGNKEIISRRFMMYKKKIGSIYNSYVMFKKFAAMMAEEESKASKRQLTILNDTCNDETVKNIRMTDEDGIDTDLNTSCVSDEEEPNPPVTKATVAEMGRGPEGEGYPSPRPTPKRKASWWMRAFIEAPIKGHRKAG
jgi:hypothetical protein